MIVHVAVGKGRTRTTWKHVHSKTVGCQALPDFRLRLNGQQPDDYRPLITFEHLLIA